MSTASETAPAAHGRVGRSADAIMERRQRAAELYQQGLTLKQVGEIVGRSESVVRHDLEVLGIKRRQEWKRGRGRIHPVPQPRPCARCGEVFTPQRATHVGKFCSRLCHNRTNAEGARASTAASASGATSLSWHCRRFAATSARGGAGAPIGG
jgi:hypothetical protein